MTPLQRIEHYAAALPYPQHLFIGGDGRMGGTMVMGNNYRVKSGYYGGYPAGYLRRLRALFPDKKSCLHLFSGKVDLDAFPGKTVDINKENNPDYVDDAQTLLKVPLHRFDLAAVDPPYSVEDAVRYGTVMIKRNVVMRALSRMRPGSHVAWLDQVLPMYKKVEWDVIGYMGMVKSTNHRFRIVTVFQRK